MKHWLFAAIILLVLGGLVFLYSFAAADFNFFKVETETVMDNTYKINGEFQKIQIEDNVGDVRLVLGTEARVECCESEHLRYSVSVENGTLRIKLLDTRRWYHYLGFNLSDRALTVYLPEGMYEKLSVETDTGNIQIDSDFTFRWAKLSSDTGMISFEGTVSDSLDIETDTGNILLRSVSLGSLELETETGHVILQDLSVKDSLSLETETGELHLVDLTCATLSCEGSTADIFLENVIADKKMVLKTKSGDLFLEACDAPNVEIISASGDVTGSFLRDKIFNVNSKSGDVKVPESAGSDRCKVTTGSGDITLTVEKVQIPEE